MASDVPSKYSVLANLTVARRIYLLLSITLFALIIIGVAGLIALNSNYLAFNQLGTRVNTLYTSETSLQLLYRDYTLTLHQAQLGIITNTEAIERIAAAEQKLKQELIPLYTASETNRRINNLGNTDKLSLEAMQNLSTLMQQAQPLLKQTNPDLLKDFLKNEMDKATTPIIRGLTIRADSDLNNTRQALQKGEQQASRLVKWSGLAIIVVLVITILLGYIIYRSIALSINRLMYTIREIEVGNMSARAQLTGKDELAALGFNLDRMMDERIATQARIDHEHKQLNESVFSLLLAVSDLSERNLTVRAKVTEDATGPLADAINQLAEDTSTVLKQVRHIALSVEQAATEVDQHALSVNQLAQLEQTEAQETRQQLDEVLERFNTIAHSAEYANQIATTTSTTTTQAQATVTRTLDNMHAIRNGVKETSKRLKRLGERSQEISNIVHIIDTIAEQTTVLALNASMQATAAGDAGRGFSLIAEEIQRLAESSRDSTEQISTLVHNIQQEANVTIATMERAIEQVVMGSDLAEKSAAQMQAALQTTNELVASVETIAASSADQIAISRAIQVRAERILEATQTTGRELGSLTTLTKNMADYSRRLVNSVNVFKLEA